MAKKKAKIEQDEQLEQVVDTNEPKPVAPKLISMKESGRTVNISEAAQGDSKVIVLFKSRIGQRFDLSNGKNFTLIGSGAHLASAHGGVLPPATYTVNEIDRELWERALKEWGNSIIKPWMNRGIIAIKENREKAVDTAFNTNFARTIDDPIVTTHEATED